MEEVLQKSLPALVIGAGQTIVYALAAIFIGFLIAVHVCLLRLSKVRILSRLAGAYVSFFRGIPLIVQLLIFYYCLPVVGINVSPSVAAVGALSMCTAAYQAEILRGGFLAIPQGQIEAAEISGLSRAQILWHIQVPLALRLTFPSLVNEATTMIIASSLISVVGVLELTRSAQNVAAATYQPLPAYLIAGAIYLLVISALSIMAAAFERRLGAGMR